MKRFTETTKWADPWFRELSPESKLLWLWLLDNCDHSGVIRPDMQLAAFQIGKAIDGEHIIELGERLKALPDGKIHISKFIRFQYGVDTTSLSEESSVHRGIIKALRLHGILDNPLVSLSQPLPKAYVSIKDKDKDKDKDKEGGPGGNGLLPEEFTAELFRAYGRTKNATLSYREESGIAEVVRRPDYENEWRILQAFQTKEKKYFPQSLSRLLENWQETLDRASVWQPPENGAKHVKSIAEQNLDAITRQLDREDEAERQRLKNDEPIDMSWMTRAIAKNNAKKL